MIAIPAVDAVGVAQSPAAQYGHNQVSVKNSHLAHEQELMAPSLVSMDKSSFRVSSIPPQARGPRQDEQRVHQDYVWRDGNEFKHLIDKWCRQVNYMGCAGRRKLDYVWRTLFEVAANGSKHNITTVGSTAAAPPPPTPPTPSTISSNSMYLRGQFNRPVPSWRQWASRQDNGVHAPPHYPEHTVPHAAHSTESAGSAKAQAERVEAKVPALAARRRRHVPNFHPYSMSTTMCSTKMMASTVTPTVRPPRARRSSTISILHLQKRHRRLKQDSQGQTLTDRACTRTSGERLASCKKRVACTPCSLHRLPIM